MAMIDVGDVLPGLGITTTVNATGALGDPSTLQLTLTLPDGSELVGTYPAAGGDALVIARASAGLYACTYVSTLPGYYRCRWAAVGNGCDGAYGDVWNVSRPGLLPLISLDDIREQTRATSSDSDERLRWFGLVASRMAEDHTQVWRRQTISETFDGGGPYLQLQRPVVSVTSVLETGAALSSSGYVLNGPRGKLYRGTTAGAIRWLPGVQNVAVVYVAAPADGVVPETILQGVRLEVQHLWDSQRGGSGLPRQTGADFTTDPRTGFSIPNRVLEMWQSEVPMGGVYVA